MRGWLVREASGRQEQEAFILTRNNPPSLYFKICLFMYLNSNIVNV